MKFIIFFQNWETCAIFIVRLHSLHVWWDFMSTILLAGFTRIWRFFLSVQQNTNKNHHYCYEKYQILSKSAQLVQKELFTSWANFKCFDWILCGLNNWWIPPIDNWMLPKIRKMCSALDLDGDQLALENGTSWICIYNFRMKWSVGGNESRSIQIDHHEIMKTQHPGPQWSLWSATNVSKEG